MDDSGKHTILFLCGGNACRSQMAEGWARHFGQEAVDVYSAGVSRQGLDPRAVKVMAEAGVDIAGRDSKLIEELPIDRFDYVITLCDHANEECPYFDGGGGRRLHRAFEDPPVLAANAAGDDEGLVHYRRVRDEIKAFVEGFLGGLLGK